MRLNNIYAISAIKKLWSIIFGFGATVLITRYLGPTLKGEYSYILNIVSIVFVILNLGIANIYPNYRRKHSELYLSTFLSLIITIFLFLIFIYFICLVFVEDFTIRSILLLSIICVLSFQLNYINLVENIKVNAISYIVSSAFNFILSLIVFWVFDKHLIIALCIFGIKEIIIIVFNLISLKDKFDFKKVDIKLWLTLISKGSIPMLTTLLVTLNYRADIVILNKLNVEYFLIGIYATGLAVAEYTWIVPDIFKDVLINKTAKSDSIESLTFSIRASTSILCVIYIGFLFLGKFFISTVFGMEFILSYPITMIIYFGTFSMVYTKLLGTIYIASGKWFFYFVVLLTSVIVNIFCNFLTIPLFGIYGAALSSIISYFLAGVSFLIKFKKDYNVNVNQLLLLNKEDFLKIIKLLKKGLVI
ncbi:oligosaccharide flippase family protein [Anaeromicrobium sediminis]|uniref:oligosaccharide flippase family protein n=1 Tax=Anaeromicrobium sediminis TaxID=1478221 RepID=UPI001595D8B4|nr:polysaccharide biosynthesis C-terminal domain-containing protein [Anaeromicrobium sediminis]